jgi:hypothetical protein
MGGLVDGKQGRGSWSLGDQGGARSLLGMGFAIARALIETHIFLCELRSDHLQRIADCG